MAEPSEQELRWLLDEKYDGKETPQFQADVARLRTGEPLDYIIGFSPFLGCKIDLSARPLIPRSETEYWLQQALQEIPEEEPIRALDLFSGSGCIGVAVAKHRPRANVECAELEPKLVEQIVKNAALNDVTEQLKAFTSDVFSSCSGLYDFIFANPPYIALDATDVEDSVREWEPASALYSSENGLALIKRTIAEAPSFLTPGGVLFIEHDPRQTQEIASYASEFPYQSVTTLKDQYGRERVTRLSL